MALGFGANSPDSLCVSAMRPAGVYGPRSRYGVATSIKLISRGMMGPIRMGHGKNRVSTVHVRDVCGAAIHLSRLPWDSVSRQVYNVADESAYTVAELSRFLGQEVGFPFAPFVHLPFGVMEKMTSDLIKKAKKKGRISMVDNEMSALLKLDALLDISKLKATGWSPKYPDALIGLKETIASYREEGWI
jgi:nucleoside-diphosphate-sugar epimerase